METTPPLIVLDLDETLIHSTTEFLGDDREILFNFRDVQTGKEYIVYKRPYADEFLQYCFANFHVGVFTAGDSEYAGKVCSKTLPNSSSLCIPVKELQCIGIMTTRKIVIQR